MIYRNNHDNDYTVLPNSLLQHSTGLDPESLGVLVYLLSHPANWRVYGTEIAKHFDVSTDRVTRITKRLQKHGYLVRKEKVSGWDWDVFDHPAGNSGSPLPEKTDATSANSGSTLPQNPALQSNKKESNKKKKTQRLFTLEEAVTLCPANVPVSTFQRWVQYKMAGEPKISARSLNIAIKTFELFDRKNCNDFDRVIDIAIDKKWQSMDPAWGPLKQFFTDNTDALLLAGVK